MDKPRPKPSPGLVAALNHYAKSENHFLNPTVFVHQRRDGTLVPWPMPATCQKAADFIQDEELACIELKALKDGLKRHGQSRLYELIMGEALE